MVSIWEYGERNESGQPTMGGTEDGSLAGGSKKQCYVILRRIPDVEDSSAGFCGHGNE